MPSKTGIFDPSHVNTSTHSVFTEHQPSTDTVDDDTSSIVIHLDHLRSISAASSRWSAGSAGLTFGPPDMKAVTPENTRLSTTRMVILAGSMMFTYFLGAASTSSVTLLIPTIAKDLGETTLQTQWVSSSYALAFACGLLFSGRLGDIHERKSLYIVGLSLYALFAAITGVLRNRVALCVTRAFSGLGLAIASPAGFGIIGVNIKHEPARTIVFTATGFGIPIGGAFGNVIGGAMAYSGPHGWSYLFFLLAGLALLLIAIASIVIPGSSNTVKGKDHRIDWAGGILITSAICLFTFSLTESGIASDGWHSPHVPALLVTSVILFSLFIIWSLYLEHRTTYPPIIRMSLFTRRGGMISIICACCFFISITIYGWIYTTAIFYQKYKGMSPLGNAIITLTNTVTGIVAAAVIMYLAPRVRTPYLIAGGCTLTATSCILYAAWPVGTRFWAIEFPAQALQAWGITCVIGLGNILISNLVNQDEQSIGGAIFQTSGQVGAALGICLSSLISSEIEQRRGDVLAGVRVAYWFCAANALLVVVIAIFGLRKVRLARDVGLIK